ncbi:MAG TPA: FG-GAP-like repeat-containing protein [Thermoanaerobaculia bacterium]
MLRRALPLLLALTALGAAPPAPGSVPPEAAALRSLGLAQLENERLGEAAETFRKLAKLTPDDPLPYADLAVIALRQQKSEEATAAVAQALAKAPGRADLLAIQGDVLQWSGKSEEALAAYHKAAMAAPDRVEIQYGLYRLAGQGAGPEAEAALKESLQALARLRPENLVVLLQQGQRAIAAGDRAGATQSFLRVKELLGPTPPPAVATTLTGVLTALESGDASTARVPAIRLENVLKPTPAYQAGLHELTTGLLGNPVERFVSEPPSSAFGDPVPVRFKAVSLAKGPVAGRALAAGDFDGDDKLDLAWIEAGEKPRLLLLKGTGGEPVAGPEAAGITGLLAADLDNDGKLDLIAFGPKRLAFWRGKGDGTFEDATAGAGFGAAGAEAAAALDYDIEGDLDLAIGSTGIDLFRNALQGPLEPVGKQTFPPTALSDVRALVASDLDRDGDLDLVVAHAKGITWLDNLRQGHFADRTAASGLAATGPVEALASADLDNDGLPDLIAAGDGLTLWHNLGGRFAAWSLPGLPRGKRFTSILTFDADNDGRLDLAAAGPDGAVVLGQRGTIAQPAFEPLPVEGAPGSATALIAADLDGDGDLDLVAAGPSGLVRLENAGGNQNHWLDVRLRALATGNGKNNLQGIGSTLEVRAGTAYQFREAAVTPAHFGLGRLRQADLLRVVWTNGVPQNRLQPGIDQRIVEEQVLKGSCPFLYAWNGERFAFVTDLLWNSPVGLPVAPGVWAGADPHELVRVDGARPVNGVYRLRVTEELWEAAWFDAVRLWVVDHPAGVEVASSLKVIPGERQPVKVLAARDVRPVAAAWDGRGEDVTSRVRVRDEVYASGFEPGPYQGVAKPWTFTFDLGESPGTSVRLLLDGWIFPADASLNLAAAQRPDYPYLPPRLEVETGKGWQTLIPSMGFPAGKTKTMVIDTPALPAGAHRLRIVTSLWLGWDRIAWTRTKADEVPVVQARLDPRQADLHFRGFSRLIRRSPNGPHGYVYEESTKESPWLPFPGHYTRYGDVQELLKTPDDRSVILAPGDEIALEFDATALPPVAPGWERTLFFESNGWDKDADRNTFEAQQMEPLPFRGMQSYGEPFPETPELREYREKWLTRILSGAVNREP